MRTNDELEIFAGRGYESNPQEPPARMFKSAVFKRRKISARISHNDQSNSLTGNDARN
jgi:hypothetical protein